MKRYRLSVLVLSSGIAVLSSSFFIAQQTLSQQNPPQKGEMKSTGDMSMGGMIKQCHEHHHAMTKKMDEVSKTLEEAEESNDLAKVRAAIDQAQKQLAEMKEHMNMCGNMMHMMEKMQGMGGMMKGDSK